VTNRPYDCGTPTTRRLKLREAGEDRMIVDICTPHEGCRYPRSLPSACG